jgi:hypothetical protein
MHFILLHVDFEDGLSILVLVDTATWHKNLQLETEKSFCRPLCSKSARPLHFTLARLFQTLVHVSVQEDWAIFERLNNGDGFKQVLLTMRLYGQAKCRTCHGVTNLVYWATE